MQRRDQAANPRSTETSSVGAEISVRHGTILVEAVMAVALVMMLLVGIAQLVVFANRQRSENTQKQIAAHVLANVMEQIYATPWDELSEEFVSTIQIAPEIEAQMDDPKLDVSVESIDGELATKAIHVRLSWLNRAGQRVDPIVLTAWKHGVEATTP